MSALHDASARRMVSLNLHSRTDKDADDSEHESPQKK